MKTIKTLSSRIKDKHAKWLVAMAREVNQVFNFCNEAAPFVNVDNGSVVTICKSSQQDSASAKVSRLAVARFNSFVPNMRQGASNLRKCA